jgi:hypothetical protein
MNKMSSSSPRVFISYSSKNKAQAQRLASMLLMNGIRVWLDDWEILVGHNVYDSVYDGVLSCDYLAIVLTADALNSRWVTEELSFARQRELEERNVIVLPLLFESIELPLHLRMRKYADFTEWEKGFRELMRTFGKDTSMSLINEQVLERVHKIIKQLGYREIVGSTRKVTTQAASRIAVDSALIAGRTDAVLREQESSEDFKPAQIILEIRAAEARIPIWVNLKSKSSQTLAMILRLLGLEEVIDAQWVSFFMLYQGRPIGIEESLEEAGVMDGGTIQIGAYSFAIE